MVRNLCVDPVVQILDSSWYHLSENWLDTFHSANETGQLYSNVFTVDNPCNYTDRQIQEGEEFYFRLAPDASNNCAVCAMAVVSPNTRLKIKVD